MIMAAFYEITWIVKVIEIVNEKIQKQVIIRPSDYLCLTMAG